MTNDRPETGCESLKILRIILWIVGGISLFFASAPLVIYGIVHEGVLVLFALAAFCGLVGWLCGAQKWAGLRRVMLVLFFLGMGAAAGLTAHMIIAGYGNAPSSQRMPGAAIVLGCEVRSYGPSLMLRKRLDKAAAYLQEYDDILCVVSGGQGDNEPASEAAVMKEYLVQKGVNASWIVLEDQSTSTKENIVFSAAILKDNMLEQPEVVIFTDGFHQLRAAYYARQNGLRPYAVSCATPWGLAPSYWVREMLAICQLTAVQLFGG